MTSFQKRVWRAKRDSWIASKKAMQARYMNRYSAAQKIQKMVRGMNARVNLNRNKPWDKGFYTTSRGRKFYLRK